MNDKTHKTLAVFDFDGTITQKDTLFDFVRFYVGTSRFLVGTAILSPILLAFKLGFITNERAKQKLFSHFFKGKKESDFNTICEKYSKRIDEILIPEAIEKLKWHQTENHIVIIDSASVCNWIAPWAKSVGIEAVIGTRIEIKEGMITGKFMGKNCHGQEKVNRLSEFYPNRDSYQLYAYGDSEGDKELLSYADHPFFRKY